MVGRPGSDMEACTHFPGCTEEVSRRLSISDNMIAVLLLPLCAPPFQQQSSAISGKTARRYNDPVQDEIRPKPSKLKLHTRSSPRCPSSAPITLQLFYHHLSRQIVPSLSSVLVAPVLPIFFYTDDTASHRSVLIRLQLVLLLKRRTHELHTLSK